MADMVDERTRVVGPSGAQRNGEPPQSGKSTNRPWWQRKWGAAVIALAGLIVGAAIGAGGGATTKTVTTQAASQTVTQTATQTVQSVQTKTVPGPTRVVTHRTTVTKTVTASSPAPAPAAASSSAGGSAPAAGVVHPGAFCSPEGATGVTTAGTSMVCGPASDGRDRWHSG